MPGFPTHIGGTGAASIATTKGKQGGRGHVVSCPYRGAGTETALGYPLHGEFLAFLGAGKKDAGFPDTHRRDGRCKHRHYKGEAGRKRARCIVPLQSSRHGNLRYATHFMGSFLRFLAHVVMGKGFDSSAGAL